MVDPSLSALMETLESREKNPGAGIILGRGEVGRQRDLSFQFYDRDFHTVGSGHRCAAPGVFTRAYTCVTTTTTGGHSARSCSPVPLTNDTPPLRVPLVIEMLPVPEPGVNGPTVCAPCVSLSAHHSLCAFHGAVDSG